MYKTIADIKKALSSGQTVSSILEDYIHLVNEKSSLNAFVEIFEDSSRDAARRIDDKIKQGRFSICNLDVSAFCEKVTGYVSKGEKEKMDALYEGKKKPYDEALEYRNDSKGDPYYFICPQYWCTQPGKERALTEEEAKNGTCGKIIKNLKKPDEGEHVYDRTSDLHRAYVPGFVKKKCYPCCFKDWNKPDQIKSRETCNPEKYSEPTKKRAAKKQTSIETCNVYLQKSL